MKLSATLILAGTLAGAAVLAAATATAVAAEPHLDEGGTPA